MQEQRRAYASNVQVHSYSRHTVQSIFSPSEGTIENGYTRMEIELRRITVQDNRGRAGGWPHTLVARLKVHRSLETMSFV